MAVIHCTCRVIKDDQLKDALTKEFNKFATPEEFKEAYITGPDAQDNRRNFLNKTRDELDSALPSPEKDARQCPPCITETEKVFTDFFAS